MKNKYYFLFVLLTIASTCWGQDSKSSSDSRLPPSSHHIPSNDPRLHYMGRVITTDSAAILSWTASSVSFHFRGTGIKALIKDQIGDNYYNVLVDGRLTKILHPHILTKTYTLASGLRPGPHSLELFKRTEWAMGKTWLYAILLDAHTSLLAAEAGKNRKIEFYGNSSTCGYAVEDSSGKDRGTAPYENAYVAYAAITARHFNAE